MTPSNTAIECSPPSIAQERVESVQIVQQGTSSSSFSPKEVLVPPIKTSKNNNNSNNNNPESLAIGKQEEQEQEEEQILYTNNHSPSSSFTPSTSNSSGHHFLHTRNFDTLSRFSEDLSPYSTGSAAAPSTSAAATLRLSRTVSDGADSQFIKLKMTNRTSTTHSAAGAGSGGAMRAYHAASDDDSRRPLIDPESSRYNFPDSSIQDDFRSLGPDDLGTGSPGWKPASARVTSNLVFAVVVAVLASFQFGWNLGVANTPEKVIRVCPDPGTGFLSRCVPMSSYTWGLVVGLFAIGGLCGGLSGGTLCARFGRKYTLIYNNVFFIVGGAMMGLASNVATLGIGRFIVGIGAGIGTSAVPMYVVEVSPTAYRGAFGVVNQLAVVIGILVAQIFGLFFSTIPGWRYLFAAPIIPAVLQLLLLPFAVESPRHLIANWKSEESKKALKFLRDSADVDHEVTELERARDLDASSTTFVPFIDLVTVPFLRKAMLISLVAQFSQQFSGVNGVIQYSTTIFEGILGESAKYVTVGVGSVNLMMTLVSAYMIERAGRRVLLLSSQFGMATTAVLIVVASLFKWEYAVGACAFLFIACFAIGLGPIPWIIVPEMFPTYAVSRASSICVATNWLSSFAVVYMFPPLSDALGDFTFLPFAVFSASFGTILWFMLPEIKGKTVEQVIRLLEGRD